MAINPFVISCLTWNVFAVALLSHYICKICITTEIKPRAIAVYIRQAGKEKKKRYNWTKHVTCLNLSRKWEKMKILLVSNVPSATSQHPPRMCSSSLLQSIQMQALPLPPRVSFSLIIHEVSKQNGEEARRSIQIIPEQTSADSLNCSICLPKIRQFILISGE